MPAKRGGHRILAKVPGATPMPSRSAKINIGVSHSSANAAESRVPRTNSEREPRFTSSTLRWIMAALVVFAVLAIHDHAPIAALAALAAVVVGMLAEVAP